MAQTSSFFELAALLIPVLMLSGLATAKLIPPSQRKRKDDNPFWAEFWVPAMFGFLPFFAELFALAGVMGSAVSPFAIWVICFTIAWGVGFLALVLVLPWTEFLWKKSRRVGRYVLLLGFGVLLVTSTQLLKVSQTIQALSAQTPVEAVDSELTRRFDANALAVAESELQSLEVDYATKKIGATEYRQRALDATRMKMQILLLEGIDINKAINTASKDEIERIKKSKQAG